MNMNMMHKLAHHRGVKSSFDQGSWYQQWWGLSEVRRGCKRPVRHNKWHLDEVFVDNDDWILKRSML